MITWLALFLINLSFGFIHNEIQSNFEHIFVFEVEGEGVSPPLPKRKNKNAPKVPEYHENKPETQVVSWTPEILGPERHAVMREKKTERAFSGKYLYELREGAYVCAACKQPLFSSKDKYESGAGWPSFIQPIEKRAVYYLEDWALSFKRYEVLCRGCDSHLGHVFNDGPPPKNLRYCINSIALILESP